MEIVILAFARARDELGFAERTVECRAEETPREIVARIAPGLELVALRAAVDRGYHGWDVPIGAARELALIPPVSGG
jgi:molybdopterin converting factor small subunit